ncbi:unnamed protein product [Orchesella dallaii]|uniref:Transforming acidic coiled-coil-containing protein C-terminal domain-containing protein n=1 Tax=Orchesella dallaii TaxID=48710 RepID=A0ABP1QZA2_9HEXA
MGNSPSRSELHGEHMSSLANNPTQDPFPHSYPTKFSSVPLPGIHNEYTTSNVPSGPMEQSNHNHHEFSNRQGAHSADPMYSMDSLNVCGNNSVSMTSSDLPPSSLSPANCQDPWKPPPFADESLHSQCRNLSRLHKDLHHQEDDEGLSSSTFESDSLNPDATLSGMSRRLPCTPPRNSTPPKPEVAEEATEAFKLATAQMPAATLNQHGSAEMPSTLIDYSITINGRKVSTSEETPLPIILASQKEADNNGRGISSKIGITSSELTTNTKSRGRMKSPPPPPPVSKISNGSEAEKTGSTSTIPSSSSSPPMQKEIIEKKSSPLNSLFSKNVYYSNRKSSIEFSESNALCGGEVNVIQTPLSQSQPEKNSSSRNNYEALIKSSSENEDDASIKTKKKVDEPTYATIRRKSVAEIPPVLQINERESNRILGNNIPKTGKITDISPKTASEPAELGEIALREEDVLIRPCDALETEEALKDIVSNHEFSSTANKAESTNNSNAVSDSSLKNSSSPSTISTSFNSLLHNNSNETVDEQILDDEKYRQVHTNKTELDCKDGEDVNHASADEIKPVSCSSNGEMLDKKGECINSKDVNPSTLCDLDEDAVVAAAVVERCQTSNKFLCLNGTYSKAELKGRNGDSEHVSGDMKNTLDSPSGVPIQDETNLAIFGTDEVKRGEEEELCRENTLQKSPSLSSSETDFVNFNRSKWESISDSSRENTFSLEINNPPTNGLLNCNRLSLCSQPDNELDVEIFGGSSKPMVDVAIIQDQPLSSKGSDHFSESEPSENEYEVYEIGKISKNTSFCSGGDPRGPESDSSFPTTDAITKHEITSTQENSKQESEVMKPSTQTQLQEEILCKDESLFSAPKLNGHGHQRRLSMSKMDFDCTKNLDETHMIASSAPTCTSQLEKIIADRKASFPELYVNTEALTAVRKLSTGSDKSHNRAHETTTPRRSLTGSFGETSRIAPKDASGETKENSDTSVSKPPFANDFLQTLGEIYASKSKLLTNKLQTQTVNPISSPKEKESVIILDKEKAPEPSIDTVESFECQDRSISEYNISPRSAREVVTDSLLNCSSMSSSSLSQKSIVTIQEVDEKPAPVPFSAGVVTQNSPEVGQVSSVEVTDGDIVIPRLNQSKSLNNSATYKKKPTFIRGRVSNGNSLPCVDIFEPPCHTKKEEFATESSPQVEIVESPNYPPPPPMPPLHYCQSTSGSSASSSIGDPSDIQDKGKLPCYNGREQSNKKLYLNGLRSSPEKTFPKVNGNVSSECSLVELSLATQKSTSDAIIVELKKAQAKKLKSIENKQIEPMLIDFRNNPKNSDEAKPNLTRNRSEDLAREPREDKQSTISEIYASKNPVQQSSTEIEHPEEPPVKAIVNGKHTSNIVVNSAPIEAVNKESLKRNNRLGGVQTAKNLPARGNIMSPSLSGNYTEMNGIDSETMGASSIHEDELSGQLQQKENHINELQGNVEEIQTTNKLDGASFRRVLNEYEKTLSMFIQQIDQLKQRMDEAEAEKQTLIKERDQALEDLRNVESAFSDVHRKYERAKALLENMKSNEDTLIRRDQEMLQRIQNRDKKIDMIKEKAQDSIEKMHMDYETRIKEMEFENAKLRAQYRKLEMKLSTLENDVEQKAKENAQLSALCDELINGQVGQV